MTDVIVVRPAGPWSLRVERGGRLLQLTATPENGKGITSTVRRSRPGLSGVQIEPATRSVGLAGAVPAVARRLWHVTDLYLSGLGQTFSPHGVAAVLHEDTSAKAADRRGRQPRLRAAPVSIIGMRGLGRGRASTRDSPLLALLIAINIFFGIPNMLPMLPLDGGHVAIAAYERIRTRRGEAYYQRRHHQAVPGRLSSFLAFLAALRALRPCSSTITHPIQLPLSDGRHMDPHRRCCRPAGADPSDHAWAAWPSAAAPRSPCSR